MTTQVTGRFCRQLSPVVNTKISRLSYLNICIAIWKLDALMKTCNQDCRIKFRRKMVQIVSIPGPAHMKMKQGRMGVRGRCPILKIHESWSKVGHAAREMVQVFPVTFCLETVVGQMVNTPPPQ